MKGLTAVLQAELEIVEELLTVCRREQEALVADDVQTLQAAVEKKAGLARKLAALEEERQQAMAQEATFAGDATQGLEEVRRLLQQKVQELKEVNETNRMLARQSLAYTRKVLELLLPEDEKPVFMNRLV